MQYVFRKRRVATAKWRSCGMSLAALSIKADSRSSAVALLLILVLSVTGCRDELHKPVGELEPASKVDPQNGNSTTIVLPGETKQINAATTTNVASSTNLPSTANAPTPSAPSVQVTAQFPSEIAVNIHGSDAPKYGFEIHPETVLKIPLEMEVKKPVQAAIDLQVGNKPIHVPIKIQIDVAQVEAVRVPLKIETLLRDSACPNSISCAAKESEQCSKQLCAPQLPFSKSPSEGMASPSKLPPDHFAPASDTHEISIWWDLMIILLAGIVGGAMRTLEDQNALRTFFRKMVLADGRGRFQYEWEAGHGLDGNIRDWVGNIGWGIMAACLVPMALFFAHSSLPDKQGVPLYVLAFFGVCLVAATLGAEFWRMVMSVARNLSERFEASAIRANDKKQLP